MFDLNLRIRNDLPLNYPTHLLHNRAVIVLKGAQIANVNVHSIC